MAPVRSYLIPEEVKPWAWLLVAHNLRGNVTGPLRQMSDEQLRHIAATIGLHAISLPHLLASWRLPQLEGPGLWLGTVAPAIKSELGRRRKPNRVWGANGPIARLKSLDIVKVGSNLLMALNPHKFRYEMQGVPSEQ